MAEVKFTDEFFLIPVRVFRHELEDFEETGEEVVGWARIHYTSLQLCTWHEGYPYGTDAIEFKDNTGLPLTIVRCPDYSYYCTWPIKQFEKELNKFMKKVDELFPQDLEQTEEDLDI